MIRTATPTMIPHLKRIWMRCFGDDRSYVDALFPIMLHPEQILVHGHQKDWPDAMLCFQPHVMYTIKGLKKAAYIFGVATMPEKQGKGISTKLLQSADSYLSGTGYSLSVLVPANEGLFDFYRKRGYQTGFSIKRLELSQDKIKMPEIPFAVVSRDLDHVAELRNNFHRNRSMYAQWDKPHLHALGSEYRLREGRTLLISFPEARGYAVCVPWREKVYVKELVMPEAYFLPAVGAIHSRYGAQLYDITLPEDYSVPFDSIVLPFAMVRWYDNKQHMQDSPHDAGASYIAHVLD